MTFRYDKDKEKLIVSVAERIEYNQCQLWLKRHVQGYKYMIPYKMGYWDGQIDYFNDGQINLGLWKELVKAMKEIGSNFKIENKEDFPIDRTLVLNDVQEFCNEFFVNHTLEKDGKVIKFDPRDYQVDTAFKILKNRFCMASVATSGGKTLIMSIIMFYILTNMNPDAKFLVIVPSITLVVQTTDEILSFNTAFKKGNKMECDVRIEEVMSQSPRKFGKENPNIYIGCYQSLEKWDDEFFKQFDCVIVDECLHPDTKILMSSGEYKKITEILTGEYVKTINEESLQIEDKPVEYIYKNLNKGQQMYELEMEDGSILKITGNHKVLTKNRGWVRVDNLNLEDDIIRYE